MALPTGGAQLPGPPSMIERDPTLTPSAILVAEYLYATETAYQVVVDRDRSVTRHLLLLLSLLGASAGLLRRLAGVSASRDVQPLALAVALVLGMLATIFFLMVVRLHTAFDESMSYARGLRSASEQDLHFALPLATANRYRRTTILQTDHLGWETVLLGCAFALVASLCLAVAIVIAGELMLPGNSGNLRDLPRDAMLYLIAGIPAAITFALYARYYFETVRQHSDPSV